MPATCQAVARSGSRCASPVLPGSTFCWVHDPARADDRRESSRKGGQARSAKARAAKLLPDPLDAHELSAYLTAVFKGVLGGQIQPRVGTACATLARTMMDLRAQQELEVRLIALEHQAGIRRIGRSR